MPVVERLGKRIKAMREKRGMSQERLAEAAQISRGYLARLEIGRHDPTVGTVDKLARALRVKVADLLK
jgi:transcriptional regulator with XRE-family HTH domain